MPDWVPLRVHGSAEFGRALPLEQAPSYKFASSIYNSLTQECY
jgi:hypothetical protein